MISMEYVTKYDACLCFFFFKQKTAYEMRISDWSSDVCSSDLQARPHHPGTGPPAAEVARGWLGTGEDAELPRVHARRVPSARLQPNGPLRILFGSSGPRAGRHPVRHEGSYRCLYAGHRPLGAAPY